jgi:hypothetical protein
MNDHSPGREKSISFSLGFSIHRAYSLLKGGPGIFGKN